MSKSYKLELSIPSKTFLIGEYAVLGDEPAPAIVVNTKPAFKVVARHADAPIVSGLKETNPSYDMFMQSGLRIEFNDPHLHRGGFGGSGAEKIAAYLLNKYSNDLSQITQPDAFHTLAQLKLNSNESGTDILSQLTGFVSIIDKPSQSAEAFNWHFPELGFAIIRTGFSIDTHTHLADLNTVDTMPLQLISRRCVHAFKMQDEHALVHCVNAYRETLQALGLCHPKTQALIEQLQASDVFVAVKGCGALGADTILTVYDKSLETSIKDYFLDRHLEVVATDNDLTELTWNLEHVES